MASTGQVSRIPDLVSRYENEILPEWIEHQRAHLRRDGTSIDALRANSQRFLSLLRASMERGGTEMNEGQHWDDMRHLLVELSRERAQQGYSPSETASFVFSLKQPLFSLLKREIKDNAQQLGDEVWIATQLLDRIGLYTTEVHQQRREEVIARQQQDMLELSTPVVDLWVGIVALPLIGTLDSARTQVVMENLLQRIVDRGASIAIIDITGVPTVDTLVAQHLLKTVAAARLMGAECIISGIRPQIAQTIVHLGVDLEDVITKATLADAFAIALKRLGYAVGADKG